MTKDKEIKLECFEASCVVTREPCWLYSIIGVSSQTTSKILTVRDGVLAASPVRMILYCSLYTEPVVVFNEPVYFKNGLYLEFGTTMAAAMVQYKEEK